MIEHFKYRVKLAMLYRQRARLSAAYADDIRKAKKDDKPQEDIYSIERDSEFETDMIDEEIVILATDNLVEEARRRFIPIPPIGSNGMWEQCNKMSNRHVLTNQGISHIRSLLRTERKEQVELAVMVATVLTGIIGTITGLIAVIMK